MSCQQVSDHDWNGPRIVAVGTHDTRGRWQEWARTCARCAAVQRWREWPREQARSAYASVEARP